MIAILLGSFWRALVKLRHNELALTPILGWVLGLAFFILAPLTLIVVRLFDPFFLRSKRQLFTR
jgi:hypothetical protein